METVKDILWPIVLVGGLGAFIDFLIGRTGQERAKDFLLRWWVRFDDVRWNNFGREEGLFAGDLIRRLCGRRTWSFRRFIVAISLLSLCIGVGYIKFIISPEKFWGMCYYCINPLPITFLSVFIVYLVSFSLSVSFTTFITIRMACLCGDEELKNLVIFCVMLMANYIILTTWTHVTEGMKTWITVMLEFYSVSLASPTSTLINFLATLGNYLRDSIRFSLINPITLFSGYYSNIDEFALHLLSLCPSLFRFALSLVFVGSFLLRPLVMRPISLVWARIVESDKPVFTLMFGGAAALATAISEAAKHL